jgi:hypothetical protein
LATLKLKPFKSASSALPAACVWREGPTGRLVCVNFVYFFATEPTDNKEVISVLGSFFNFFGKEIRGVIE